MRDIINFNSKEQYHGYQERYLNDKLYYRFNFKNGERYGYGEYHYNKKTRYYIR